MRLYIRVVLIFLFANSSLHAQEKKPLDHDAYEIWNQIRANQISNNGQWTFFSFGPDEKDTELRIKNTANDQSYVIPRGESVRFTNNSQYVVTLIKALKDSVKQAKRDKKKPEESPKDSLGIATLTTGDVFKAERIKSFKLPKESDGWVAYLHEKIAVKKDSTKSKQKKEEKPNEESSETQSEQKPETKEVQKPEETKKEDEKDDKKKKRKKAEGTTLVLRNLETSTETQYANVVSYVFTENGDWLIFAAANKDSTADGLYAIRTATGDSIALLTGPGDYKKITYDEGNNHLVFIANRDSFKADQQEYALYYWRIGSRDLAKELARSKTEGIPSNWWVSEHADLSFSKKGKLLFFGTAPRPEADKEDETPDDEKVAVDIWNWRDPYLQPMQLKDAKKERERSYRAIVHLNNGKIVQLATESIPDIRLGSEGNADVALGISRMPYCQLISWDSPGYYDSYLIDIRTGQTTRLLTKVQTRPSFSPDSKYVYWWDRSQRAWFVQNVKNQIRVNVSKNIPHPVHNELHDWAYEPNAHGNGGWTKGDTQPL